MSIGRSRRWVRRILATGSVVVAIAGPLAANAGADILPSGISDIGVHLLVAQATTASSGQTTINYQSAATVTPGKDTLLQAQLFNDGSIPQLSAQLVVNTGSKLDPSFTIDPSACPAETTSQDQSGNDVVTCSYSNIAAGASEPLVYLAVQTASSTVTSVATETANPDSDATIPVGQDTDETATATTTVSGNQYAFLTDGQSASKTTSDGKITESFTVPAGGTGGGGVFVNLTENTTATGTCGSGSCTTPMAEIDWVQVGGTPAVATNPFETQVTYNGVKQACNGLGGPSGCDPIFYQDPGMTSFPQVPLCTTYSSNGTGTPLASNDPCVYKLTKTASGVVTYFMASLHDQLLPITLP